MPLQNIDGQLVYVLSDEEAGAFAPPPPKESSDDGDFMRNFKKTLPQTAQLMGGTLAFLGDTVGSESLKEYGLGVYNRNAEKVSALSKPSDEFTNVLNGSANALDFLQGALGYVSGQALESAAAGLAGSLIGSAVAPGAGTVAGGVAGAASKQVAKGLIKEFVEDQVAKRAMKIVGGKAVTQEAADAAKEQATKQLAKELGMAAGLMTFNMTQELGSIYPEALAEVKNQGRELTGTDLLRVAGTAAGAAALESWADKIGLSKVLGGTAGKTLAGRAASEVPAGMLREAGTETAQTALERLGAQQTLTDDEAKRAYINAAAIGAVGGGAAGTLASAQQDRTEEGMAPEQRLKTGVASKRFNVMLDELVQQGEQKVRDRNAVLNLGETFEGVAGLLSGGQTPEELFAGVPVAPPVTPAQPAGLLEQTPEEAALAMQSPAQALARAPAFKPQTLQEEQEAAGLLGVPGPSMPASFLPGQEPAPPTAEEQARALVPEPAPATLPEVQQAVESQLAVTPEALSATAATPTVTGAKALPTIAGSKEKASELRVSGTALPSADVGRIIVPGAPTAYTRESLAADASPEANDVVRRRVGSGQPTPQEDIAAGLAAVAEPKPENNRALKAALSVAPTYTPAPPTRKANPTVQTKIAQTFQKLRDALAPDYKETGTEKAVFDSYLKAMPKVVIGARARNYKELVEKAYTALKTEVKQQFQALQKEGVKLEWHEDGAGDYTSSAEMLADVHKNGHLWVFKGGDPHTALGEVDPDTGVTYNDMFRAVHDFYGHAINGAQFGKNGEENAWETHGKMFSPLARIAMSSETRGQNSWVNFSGQNREALAAFELARIDRAAAAKQEDPAQRDALLKQADDYADFGRSVFTYAQQKAVALPFDAVADIFTDVAPQATQQTAAAPQATKTAAPSQEGAGPAAVAGPAIEAIHAEAEAKGIAWNDNPAFMSFTEGLTGKRRLDDLDPAQRQTVLTALQQRAPGPLPKPLPRQAASATAAPAAAPQQQETAAPQQEAEDEVVRELPEPEPTEATEPQPAPVSGARPLPAKAATTESPAEPEGPVDLDVAMRRMSADFAKGKGQAVRDFVRAVVSPWMKKPPVTVTRSHEDVPSVNAQYRKEQEQGATGNPPSAAVVSKPDGSFEVFIFDENLPDNPDEAALRILADLRHEIVGHFGPQQVFGRVRVRALYDTAAKLYGKRLMGKAAEYGISPQVEKTVGGYDVFVVRGGQKVLLGKKATEKEADLFAAQQFLNNDRLFGAVRWKAFDELVAELAESDPQDSLVKQMIAAIAEFLRKVGFPVKLTESEIIRDFILPSRKYVETGKFDESRRRTAVKYGQPIARVPGQTTSTSLARSGGIRASINGYDGFVTRNTVPGERGWRATWFEDGEVAGHIDLTDAQADRVIGGAEVVRTMGGQSWTITPFGGATLSRGGLTRYMTPLEQRSAERGGAAEKLAAALKTMPSAREMADVAITAAGGRAWYKNAAETLIKEFGPDAPRFAALTAALSPQNPVPTNIKNSWAVWDAWDAAGRPTDPVEVERIYEQALAEVYGKPLDSWTANAVRSLVVDDALGMRLSGSKVDSFHKNLSGIFDEVTNDTWMAVFHGWPQSNVAGGRFPSEQLQPKGQPGRGTGYTAASIRTRQAAEIASDLTGDVWTPAEIQAAVWSWTKSLIELRDSAGETRTMTQLLEDPRLTEDVIRNGNSFTEILNEVVGKPAPVSEGAPAVAGAPRPGAVRAARRLANARRPEPEGEASLSRSGKPRVLRGPAKESFGLRQWWRNLAYPEFNAKPRQPGAVTGVGIHFSPIAGLKTLDPKKAGTAYAGGERRRFGMGNFGARGGLAARLGFYLRSGLDHVPEREQVLAGAQHAYGVTLTNLYNPMEDRSLIDEAKRLNNGIWNPDLFEELVSDAGYDGYVAPPMEGIIETTITIMDIGDVEVPVSEVRFSRKGRGKKNVPPEERYLPKAKGRVWAVMDQSTGDEVAIFDTEEEAFNDATDRAALAAVREANANMTPPNAAAYETEANGREAKFFSWFRNSKMLETEESAWEAGFKPIDGSEVMDYIGIPDKDRAKFWASLAKDQREALVNEMRPKLRPAQKPGEPQIWYHGTARDIRAFRAKQADAIFVSRNPRFAQDFSRMSQQYMVEHPWDVLSAEQIAAVRQEAKSRITDQVERDAVDAFLDGEDPLGYMPKELDAALREVLPTGPNIMPVHVRAENPFDYENEDHIAELEQWLKDNVGADSDYFIEGVRQGDWAVIENEAVQDGIKALGHDSFFVSEGGDKNLGVYSSNQLKSAIGNNGEFGEDGDVALRRAGNRATFDAPERNTWDSIVYMFQDKQRDLKQVMDAIKKKGGQIADEADPYVRETLFHARAATRTKSFYNDEMLPLLREMHLRGVKLEDFEEYLLNRQAEETNKIIAARNPGNLDLADGGSGVETAEARKYLAGLTADKKRAYEALGKMVDKIVEGTRQTLVDTGQETQQTIDGWKKAFPHYVPLHREDAGGNDFIGQGVSIRGSFAKGRTGSKRKVVDILGNIANQRDRAIVMGEKIRVGNALVRLVELNPNDDFWKLDDNPPKVTKLGPDGIVHTFVDPNYKARKNVVVTKVKQPDGSIRERAVVFDANPDSRSYRMAMSLKNLDAPEMGEFIGAAAKVTRYFAAINTQYNPIFGMVNLVRDVQTGLLNLSTTPLRGKQAEVSKLILPALRGIYADARAIREGKHPTSQWAQVWEEFQREGGPTGFRDMFATGQERGADLQAELKRLEREGLPIGKSEKVFDFFKDLLSDYNTAMENAMRLAAYKVGVEQGMSKQSAAAMAKGLTVNFNKKGQLGSQIGALYAFFNASTQGIARLAETMKGPAGKKIATGGLMLGALQAMLLSGYDEDEPPEFIRQRAFVIPFGDSYITIPMPLGFHVIPNVGRIGTDIVMGGFRDVPKKVTNLIDVFADAFNPIGNAGLSLQTLAPTAIDPLAALAENRDWTGKPIARPDYSPLTPEPGFTRAKDTASSISKAISESLNWLSGGTEFQAGMLSPTPDQIDYLIGQATGGVGRELLKASQTAEAAVTGEELPLYKVPGVGRFVGTTEGQAPQASKYFTNLKRINAHELELRGRRQTGQPVAEYLRDNPEARLVPMANAFERRISQLRTQKRRLLDQGADRDRIRTVENLLTEQYRLFNERVSAAREAQP